MIPIDLFLHLSPRSKMRIKIGTISLALWEHWNASRQRTGTMKHSRMTSLLKVQSRLMLWNCSPGRTSKTGEANMQKMMQTSSLCVSPLSINLFMFLWLCMICRSGNFDKSVIRAFHAAGYIFDVLSNFGELSEETIKMAKYAKWKAAYIHKWVIYLSSMVYHNHVWSLRLS